MNVATKPLPPSGRRRAVPTLLPLGTPSAGKSVALCPINVLMTTPTKAGKPGHNDQTGSPAAS